MMKKIFPLLMALCLCSCASNLEPYQTKLFKTGNGAENSISAVWLGTAGLFLSDGETGIFIDPFVSRYGLLKVISGFALEPRPEKVREWIARINGNNARAVLVSHSHYDHAMDAPYFAKFTGARLFGSRSTAMIGRGAGLSESQIQRVKAGESVQVGKFDIRFIPSRHSPVFLGRALWPGKIETPVVPPASASDYREGESFAIWIGHPKGTLAHIGSAGYIPGMFKELKADIVFLSIAARGDTSELIRQTVDPLEAKVAVPIHMDNFFSPVDREMSFLWGVDFAGFCETAFEHRPSFEVKTLPMGKPVVILP
jgi:L-ascorbate metabolism protein UlaG (beta-lactamase superfamily)